MANGIVHGQGITIENKNIAYSLPAGTDSVWYTESETAILTLLWRKN